MSAIWEYITGLFSSQENEEKEITYEWLQELTDKMNVQCQHYSFIRRIDRDKTPEQCFQEDALVLHRRGLTLTGHTSFILKAVNFIPLSRSHVDKHMSILLKCIVSPVVYLSSDKKQILVYTLQSQSVLPITAATNTPKLRADTPGEGLILEVRCNGLCGGHWVRVSNAIHFTLLDRMLCNTCIETMYPSIAPELYDIERREYVAHWCIQELKKAETVQDEMILHHQVQALIDAVQKSN